jgi:uncharacterized protein YecE (DUF72 family)
MGKDIRIGIGGWTFEPWRGPFYPAGLPQKRELEFASRALTAIEINGTYYGSQKPASFIKWREEAPEDFVFAVKGPRFTTNRRDLATAGESVGRFLESGVLELGPKLGPINWQFLETKKFDPADFAAFLDLLPASFNGQTLRHAVEVRHPSFACEAFVALARERGVAIVCAADSPHPQIADPTAPFAYLRIMGTQQDEALGYPAPALDAWASRAAAIAAGETPEGLTTVAGPAKAAARDVFLFVIGGHKVANPAAAQALIARLQPR